MHAVFLDASKAFHRVLHMKLFEKLIQRKVPMCFVCLQKHWYKEQTMQIKWGKHYSESFHVSNGVRQKGVLSPYLFAVYLDDSSNELNNIKAGCNIGEVLLNHLTFADDICVFSPSVHWLQRILDVCQVYAESHRIIFNCNKTACMTFKAKSEKSTVTPLLTLGGKEAACQHAKTLDQRRSPMAFAPLGLLLLSRCMYHCYSGQNVKSVNQYKYLRIVFNTELSDEKDIQRQLRYQYCAANKLRASFC